MDDGRVSDEGFGHYLARERELRNIRLEEIAAKTRISLHVLRALESDEWEKLPPRVYLRGFIRAYARHVGLDENEALLRYEDYLQGLDFFPALTKKQRAARGPLWLVSILLVLALVLGYLLWWRPLHQGGGTGASPPPSQLPESQPPVMRQGLPSLPMPPPPSPGP